MLSNHKAIRVGITISEVGQQNSMHLTNFWSLNWIFKLRSCKPYVKTRMINLFSHYSSVYASSTKVLIRSNKTNKYLLLNKRFTKSKSDQSIYIETWLILCNKLKNKYQISINYFLKKYMLFSNSVYIISLKKSKGQQINVTLNYFLK